MNKAPSNFFYLNVGNRWPGFRWRGMELRPDGALQLCALPVLDGELPDHLAALAAPEAPAGIAIDSSGNVYFSVPSEDRVLRVDACDSSVAPLPCAGGGGAAPTQFRSPRGLLVPKHRAALFVADSGNHRVQIFDVASGQLIGIWGQAGPGAGPGQFNTPWALASDGDGNVYVVDYGNQRVQKFDLTGQAVPSFAENVQRARPDLHPADIAIGTEHGRTSVYVLDAEHRVVAVFDTQGNALVGRNGTALVVRLDGASNPLGLAIVGAKVLVGDNGGRRVLQFLRTPWLDNSRPNEPEYEAVGEAIGYSGSVAALALDRKGGSLVHSGTAAQPLRLSLDKGYCKAGFFWSGALSAGDSKVHWHRVHAKPEGQSNEARLRLFASTGNELGNAPTVNETAQHPFAAAQWRPRFGPPDPFLNIDDIFVWKPATARNSVREEPTQYLWVAGFLSGDGTETPVVSQLCVEFNHVSYLEHLPAIYRPPHGRGTGYSNGVETTVGGVLEVPDSQVSKDSKRTFLLRLLSLFEGIFGNLEERITELAKLFDPAAVPPEYLSWLATWFALELNETWDEPRRREAVAQAFARAGRRGTAEGLRESLRAFAGVDALLVDPILNAGWWVLPATLDANGQCGCGCNASQTPMPGSATDSALGFTTMLVGASPQGAVVGTSATLDHSHLLGGEDYGVPLFEEVAHQVSVVVYRGQVRCDQTQALVRSVIVSEKPAHVAYQLCVVEPRMRIGFQARVGVDAVIGGRIAPGQLNRSFALDMKSALGPQAAKVAPTHGRIGFLKVTD